MKKFLNCFRSYSRYPLQSFAKRDFPALHSGQSFLQKDFRFYRGYAAAGFLLKKKQNPTFASPQIEDSPNTAYKY
jgi:hypothetical protein